MIAVPKRIYHVVRLRVVRTIETNEPGIMTKYFLRRLAIAWRSRGYKKVSVSYSEAKVETFLAVLLMPAGSFVSVVIIAGVRFISPDKIAFISAPSKLIAAIGLWVLCVIVGNLWLDPQFKPYLANPSPCLSYDTEHDRNIVELQKLLIILICALGIPITAVFLM